MNITAFLYTTPPHRYLGADLMMGYLLRALMKRGHSVKIITEEDHGWYSWGDIPVCPRVRTMAHESDVFISIPELGGKATSWHVYSPYIAVCHNTRTEVMKGLNRHTPDLVVANTEQMAHTLRSWKPIVVYPPIDLTRIQPAHESRQYVTLVNLSFDKGGDIFWTLAKNMPDTAFLGVIGGHGRQDRLDLPNVTIVPQTPDMGSVYGLTKVLLFPSRHESYGMVAAEASILGIPVIARPLPGIKEALGNAGLWSDFSNMDAVKRSVQSLMTDGPTYLRAADAAYAQGHALMERSEQSLARWVDTVERMGSR